MADMENTHPHPRIIAERLGGPTRMAELLHVTRQGVYVWIKEDRLPPLVVDFLIATRPDVMLPA